jgi:hypothetical protein
MPTVREYQKMNPGLAAEMMEPISSTANSGSGTFTPTVRSCSGSTTPTGSGILTPGTLKGADSYFDGRRDNSSGVPHDCPFCPCGPSGLLDGPDGPLDTEQLCLVVSEACENLKTARTTIDKLERFPSATTDDGKKLSKAEAKIAQSTELIMAVWTEMASEIPYFRYLRVGVYLLWIHGTTSSSFRRS